MTYLNRCHLLAPRLCANSSKFSPKDCNTDIKMMKKKAASFQIYARIIPKPYLSLTRTGKSPGLEIIPI